MFGGGGVCGFVYIFVLEVFDDFGLKFYWILGILIGVILGVGYVFGSLGEDL